VPRRVTAALTVLILGALNVAALGCGGGNGDGKSGEAAKKKTPPESKSSSSRECEPAENPKPRRVKKRRPPTLRLSADKTYIAKVVTTCGTFEIKLASKQAPVTGGSFVTLAREGFYDGLSFHRIVTGFVIQGGDPRGDGSGGPGYSVRERPPRDVVYSEGVVAMAKTQVEPPGTSGSQFFVVTSDASLPPDYALLGRVTKGLDVVHRIELVPAGPDERPTKPVLIKKITIEVK
jgi:cyclophilin family peptidyl-prolyl cis-trans isomerase